MTLTEHERLCTEPGCKRAPAYPDQARCVDHRIRWTPEWRKHAKAKELA